MQKKVKIETGLIAVSILISLLAFWVEPNLDRTTRTADKIVATEGWPFVIQTTTSSSSVDYTGPYTATSSSGVTYDWLTWLAVSFVVLNIGWWLIARGDNAEPSPAEENPE